MIKVVSFDIGGTILFNKNLDKYNFKALNSLINVPYDLVRDVYKNVFQKQQGSLTELVVRFCNELDIQPNEKIFDFFKQKYDPKNNVIIFDESIISIVSNLKKSGYKIILFSNNCCLIKYNFDDDFLKNIDKIFYSYEIGYTKDEKESYKIIESVMGCLPEEILHVGDTLKSDYLEPIKNGWNAIYYGKTEDKSIRKIEQLNSIFEIVKVRK